MHTHSIFTCGAAGCLCYGLLDFKKECTMIFSYDCFFCVSCKKLTCVMFKNRVINLNGTTGTIDASMTFMCANRDDGVLYLIFTLTLYFAITSVNVFAIAKAYKLLNSQLRSDPEYFSMQMRPHFCPCPTLRRIGSRTCSTGRPILPSC